jgi:hypothetical protein
VRYALGNTLLRQFDVRKGKVEQFYPPPRRAEALHEVQISPPRKRSFECEVPAFGDVVFDLLQEEPAGSE